MHVALYTADIARAVTFYRTLFRSEPAKVREDYAKFEVAETAGVGDGVLSRRVRQPWQRASV